MASKTMAYFRNYSSAFIAFLIAGFPLVSQSQGSNKATDTANEIAQGWQVKDPYYPKYHVAPPFGWMNDPHPTYFKGAYHLFYQFSFVRDNPYGRIGLRPGQRPQRTWGHAMSADLVHWQHMPVALKPSIHGRPNDPHIFSGMVVDNDGTGVALYTINNIDIWMATSKDRDLRTFKPFPQNPVLKGPPPRLPIMGNMRDPWIWKEGNTWYMIIGSGLEGAKGPVIPLYRSTNLTQWEYMHPFYRADSSDFDFLGDNPFCECPAFFQVGNKYALVLSDKTTYLIGNYVNHRFVPEKRGLLDYGEAPSVTDGGVYVPEFLLDNKGRRIMFGWVGGWNKVINNFESDIKAGWSGMQTIPRVVTLGADGLLRFEPAQELNLLRSDHKEFSNIPLSPDTSSILKGVQGLQMEIDAVIKPGTSKIFGIEILDVLEDTKMFYDVSTKTFHFNQIAVPLELKRNDSLNLHFFIDGKTFEIYANKKIVLTEQLKPVDIKGYRFKLFARDGSAEALKVDTWKMGSIWTK